MTHPLTDKQLFIEFLSLGRDYCPDNRNGFSYDDMRAAADWQLEQVIKFMKEREDMFGGSGMIFILKDAMRPQENN